MDRINRIDRIEKWSVWRGWWKIVAGEDDVRQTYTVKHIRKGLTLLS